MAFKPKQEEKKAGAPEWMNTYGDMVTLLLTFFVMLFSMSSLDVAKFEALAESYAGRPIPISAGMGNMLPDSGMGILPDNSAPEEVQSDELADNEEEYTGTAEEIEAGRDAREREDQLNQMASDFKTYFAQHSETSGIVITSTREYIEITFPGSTLFDSGSAVLKEDAYLGLDLLAVEMEKHPGFSIRVEGHTDDVPQTGSLYPSNLHLSSARASTVVNYLVEELGFNPKMTFPEGKGEYFPIADNNTADGRALNRRVEILIYNTPEIEGVNIYN